ncbi:MAG TPA: type II toxin-antitoxin system VapC family toxin [Phenylobacterium sp.]|nr:type II toxin-antitoxin system VapC family toxin [Phenylobacterium sp.]
MVVDASAVVALLLDEPDAEGFRARLLNAGRSLISPVNHWEVLARAHSHGGEAARREAETIMARFGIQVATLDVASSRAAVDAFARFGRRTPAGLNLGDCFAYALAAAEGDGLVCKGEDFPKTDILVLGPT